MCLSDQVLTHSTSVARPCALCLKEYGGPTMYCYNGAWFCPECWPKLEAGVGPQPQSCVICGRNDNMKAIKGVHYCGHCWEYDETKRELKQVIQVNPTPEPAVADPPAPLPVHTGPAPEPEPIPTAEEPPPEPVPLPHREEVVMNADDRGLPAIQDRAKKYAESLQILLPDGVQKSQALLRLQESLMWAKEALRVTDGNAD